MSKTWDPSKPPLRSRESAMVKALRDWRKENPKTDFALGFVPGIGTALSVDDLAQAVEEGDKVGMATSAAGFLPWTKALRKGKESVSKMIGGRTGFPEESSQRKIAEFRSKTGTPAREVHAETGWYMGPEGVMKREFSDQGFMLQPYAAKELENGVSRETVSHLIRHPELFNRYPDLADIKITGGIDPGKPLSGVYYPGKGEIEVTAGNARDWMSGLGHELQHGIQNIEPKFATGSNTDEAVSRLIARNPNWEAESGKRSEAIAEYLRNMGEAEARLVERRIRERGGWGKFPFMDYDELISNLWNR